MKKFHCSICDKNHFLFYSTESPLPNEVLDYEDSKDVTQLSEDAYVIKKEHLIFAAHINVTTEIPNYEIHYKVWVKLNVKDFDEKFEILTSGNPITLESEILSELPFYPKSRGLKATLTLDKSRSGLIEVESESKLKNDQQHAITKERLIQIMENFYHLGD